MQKINPLLVKKYLPLIILGIGAVVLVLVSIFVRGNNTTDDTDDVTVLLDLPLDQRPFISLTPRDDGHWLKLKVEKFKLPQAKSVDYELLYKLPDGRPDVGVPGTIQLDGINSIERDLLLGSESSGKYRYDEGVTEGTVTLKFRNDRGKLIAKYSSTFHLQTKVKTLASIGSSFTYELDKMPSKGYFVTMETVGIPSQAMQTAVDPFGVFASSGNNYSGTVKLSGRIFRWQGNNWIKLEDGKSPDVGIFLNTSE